MEYLGDRIRKIRKEKKLTLQNVADKIGSSPIVISRYERGERIPNTEMLTKIANALNVNTASLLEESVNQKKSVLDKGIDRLLSKIEVDPAKIGKNIKLIRFRKDLSHIEFANYLNSIRYISSGADVKVFFEMKENVTEDLIKSWENGESMPTNDALVVLSEISNFSIQELLTKEIKFKVNAERLEKIIKLMTTQHFNLSAFESLVSALEDASVAIFENTEIINLYNHNHYYFEKSVEIEVKYLISDKLTLIKYFEEKILMYNEIIKDENFPSEFKMDLSIEIIFISRQIEKVKEFHSL